MDIRTRNFSSSKTKRIVHRPIIHYVFQGKTWQFEAEYDVHQHKQNIDSSVSIYLKSKRPSLVRSEHDIHDSALLIFICLGLGIPFTLCGIYHILENFRQLQINLHDDKFLIGVGIMVIVMLGYLFCNRAQFLFMLNLPRSTKMWGLTDNAMCLDP